MCVCARVRLRISAIAGIVLGVVIVLVVVALVVFVVVKTRRGKALAALDDGGAPIDLVDAKRERFQTAIDTQVGARDARLVSPTLTSVRGARRSVRAAKRSPSTRAKSAARRSPTSTA